MDRISTAQAATMPVEFKLNGKTYFFIHELP